MQRGRRRITVAAPSVVAPDAPTLTAPTTDEIVMVGVGVTVSATVTAGQVPDRVDWVLDPGGSEVVVATDSTSAYSQTWTPNGITSGAHTLVARFVYGSGSVDSAAIDVWVIPAAVLWLRADAGVTKDGSDLVSSWVDQSATGLTFTAAGGARPTWKSAEIGGRDTIRGDGAANIMSSTAALDLSAATGLTWFSVAKDTSVDGDISFEISADAGTNPGMIALPNAGGAPQFGCYANGGTLRTATIASADHVLPTVMGIKIDSTLTGTAQIVFYKNGGAGDTGAHTGADTTAGFGNDNVHLFARVGAVAPWPGDFGMVLLYATALSADDRIAVIAALGARFGITVT